MDGVDSGLMTIGELSRRTSLSLKAIREYEALGLIYSAGRSEGNYRLFDDTALWCARVIGEMRSVGLTIKEIKRLADAYFDDPDQPIGPKIAEALDRAEQRIHAQLEELEALRRGIAAYRIDHAASLAGNDPDFAATDPGESQTRLDSAPGVRTYGAATHRGSDAQEQP